MTIQPNDFWYTPPIVWDAIHKFMGVPFDPCPSEPQFDGLQMPWDWDCYINPPYSEKLKRAFIDKVIKEYEGGRYLWMFNYANSVDLHDVKIRSSATLLPEKRFRFIPGHPDLKESSPRYNNIMLLWGDTTGFKECFGHLGSVFYSNEYLEDKK